MRVHKAQVVPARSGPLRHRVGLADRAVRELAPTCRLGQRRIAALARAEVLHRRQGHRQLVVGDRLDHAVGPVDQREGLAPVALAGEEPVAELVGDPPTADPLALEVLDHPRLRGRGLQTVEEARVDGHAFADVGLALDRPLAAADHLDDGDPHRRREGVITQVVPGDRHDRAGPVAHQHVVADPHRDGLAVDRVGRVGAGEDAGLRPLRGLRLPLALAPMRRPGDVLLDRRPLLRGRHLGDQRMLRREDHVGRAEEGVWAGREDRDRPRRTVDADRLEVDLGPLGAADPVALHLDDAGRPVEPVEVTQEPLGVGRDPQHPLPHRPTDDLVAALDMIGDLFVGEHRPQIRAPVDRRVVHVGEPMLVAVGRDRDLSSARDLRRDRQLCDRPGPARLVVVPAAPDLEEDPLRPPIVVRRGGVDLPRPIVGEAEHLELALEVVDALRGPGRRVGAGLDRVLLRGKAEGVPAHRMEHVEAAHPLVAGDDVGRRVALRVADVEPVPRGIGEHVEGVVLRPLGIDVGAEGAVLVPVALPAGFDRAEVVGHGGGYARRLGRDCQAQGRPARSTRDIRLR